MPGFHATQRHTSPRRQRPRRGRRRNPPPAGERRRARQPGRATTSSAAAASACGPSSSCSRPGPPARPDSAHVPAAALIEFIHTATLLHDDVVDESARRRGRETANEAFGNPASVLVGDFLYSRAFQMMAALDSAARHPRDGRRDQHDRGRRSHAAHELRRPGHDRDPLHGGHLPQDRAAVRGRRADRRDRRARAGAGRSGARALRQASRHRLPARSTTRSTTAATPRSSARTSATTSPRASRRCRSSTRSRTRDADRPR